MPESKIRRIAALTVLVLAMAMLAFAGGGNASAAGAKAPPKGAKASKGAASKGAKVGTRARLHDDPDPQDEQGVDWRPDPPSDGHFGW